MNKNITIEDPEFERLYQEIINSKEAEKKREELSDKSFRQWLCDAIELIANRLGFHIQNLYEFTADMAASFSKGFKEGREEARRRSLRRKDQEDL